MVIVFYYTLSHNLATDRGNSIYCICVCFPFPQSRIEIWLTLYDALAWESTIHSTSRLLLVPLTNCIEASGEHLIFIGWKLEIFFPVPTATFLTIDKSPPLLLLQSKSRVNYVTYLRGI